MPDEFFTYPNSIAQKQYEALRMFFVEKKKAKEVAQIFGYTYRGFTTIISNFRKNLKENNGKDLFFKELKRGRKETEDDYVTIILQLRKKYYSVEDIKVVLDSKGRNISEKTIFNILHSHGFARLPRRQKFVKQNLVPSELSAEKSMPLSFFPVDFKSSSAGLICLLPYIKNYGIDKLIRESEYPETSQINRLSSILSFVALKSSNVRRYSADDVWCMDRGLGFFAGLNVLPKAAWFSSYSHRVTSDMNLNFLKSLHKKWSSLDLLSDTSNLDFTSVPYWGDDEHLENNWSGKRGKALASMLAVLAQDPDSGIIDYGNTNVLHKNQSAVVLEFIDFYHSNPNQQHKLKYLVFDSKFTNYQNLSKIDDQGIKFLTIRRRGKNIVDRLENIPKNKWKTIRVERAGNKKATIKVLDEIVELKGYNKKIRQVSITGHGKIKPATIIVNDFELKPEEVVRKYAKRWLVEKTISEQIDFFHLNSVSSSMVIKVDFDLTMSILTHNIFRMFSLDSARYKHLEDQSVFEKFLDNPGEIKITDENIQVKLKKKRALPKVLEKMAQFENIKYDWLNNFNIQFSGATYS